MELHGISLGTDDLIINGEIGGRAYYEKAERNPAWPGGASGVTVPKFARALEESDCETDVREIPRIKE